MIRYAIIAAVGAAFVTGIFMYGFSAGKQNEQVRAAKNALKRIAEMETNNAEFQSLDARERCVVFMLDSGLSADNCE